ncbi:KICSTOR subunit 2-like [Schistocerca gregaria]|uniref:KICSTOR subunit 2-like n=1 Tax=Schistocerca gregaria TaxID=7010 RepID=UPI00211EF54A|nr:KICSTOR subunit 2-like [Schistocerca gregaria]
MYRLFLLLKDYLYSKARIFFQQLEFSKTGYKWVKKLSGNDFDCSVSFDSQIIAFIESSQCLNVSLILEPPLNETAQGMHSWPAIYTYPQMQAPVQHWPNIISLLQDQCHYIYDSYSPETDNNSAGNVSNGVHTLYYYDSLVQITYYLTHIQERVVLSILYANKKEQGDLLTKQFTEKFCSWLKYTHVFWKALSKCT